MGRTESAFAGILLLAIVMAVLVVVFRTDTGAVGLPDSPARHASVGTGMAAFTGETDNDLCTCYQQAFAYGQNVKTDLLGVEYRGGFSACTQRLGRDGSNAWTWGWANGEKSPSKSSSCKSYQAARRANAS